MSMAFTVCVCNICNTGDETFASKPGIVKCVVSAKYISTTTSKTTKDLYLIQQTNGPPWTVFGRLKRRGENIKLMVLGTENLTEK